MVASDSTHEDFDFDQRLNLRTGNVFDKLILYLATLLFLVLVVLIGIQVTIRTIPIGGFDRSAFWTETGARLCLIIGTYMGAAACSRNDEHIRIRFILDKIELRTPFFRDILGVLGAIIIFMTLLLVSYATGQAVISGWESGMVGGLPFTIGHIQAAISFGFFTMLIYETINSFSILKAFRNKWWSGQ